VTGSDDPITATVIATIYTAKKTKSPGVPSQNQIAPPPPKPPHDSLEELRPDQALLEQEIAAASLGLDQFLEPLLQTPKK
jgi:hypothetical protein